MIDRTEVESLLACMEQIHKPNHGVIAELCRVYLAYLDAPVVRVGNADALSCFLEKPQGSESGPVHAMRGKRVRLVTDPGVVTHALNTSEVVTHEVVPRAVTDAEAK